MTLPEAIVYGHKDPKVKDYFDKVRTDAEKWRDEYYWNTPTAGYHALEQMHSKYGAPKINTIREKDRAYYNPITDSMNISIPKYGDEYGELVEYQFLQELAHKVQANKKGNVGFVKDFVGKDLINTLKNVDSSDIFTKKGWLNAYRKNYHTLGTVENEAHSVIAPKLEDEYRDIRSKQYDRLYGKRAMETYEDGGYMAMGGALPGAVGFTYARTQDPAPSNGPYAKKTKASAQDGKEMPKAYWASNDDREAYRKNLKAAAEAALNNNASDEDLLISTSYHDMNSGNNCISGVCGLNRKAGLTYNKPTDQDRFLSGEKFAQAVAKGDEDYYQVSGNFQIGDHLQYRHKEGSSSHNKIIYDIQVDDKGEKMYKVIDNAGGKDMRSRDYTEAELKELVEKGGGGYDKVNIYRPGYNLDKPLLDKEREAKTSPEARAALAERKNIQEWDASHNPGFDYSIRPESEFYNKQPEGMKKFVEFANDDAKVTALAKKLNVGKEIIHDQLLNTFGELGQENEWKDPLFGGDLSEGKSPIPIPFESTIEKVLTAVGGGKGWSVGPGQIKYKTLDPELKKQFGINRPKDLHDFDKVIPLMTAINVKNKKWMENQGDNLSTKLIGTPGVSADEIKYGIDRWVPYAYPGLPTDPVAAVRRDAQENANSYRMSTKDREDYINNYIKKNINPDKIKTFDEGSYAGRVYDLIDKNLSRTMPAQNYEQYNELMPVTVKSKKKMQKGGVIKDDRGQWAYPGEVTEIGSNDITMQGVDYPVLGVSDTGDTQMMYPDQDYKFDGEKVTEYPMAQNGDWLSKYDNISNTNSLKKEAEERLSTMGKPKSTISQYTPKPGEQAKFDKQKLDRIAEDNAPLNRMAASKGAENMQDAALFALDVMGAAEGVGAIKSALKSKAKNVITSKVTRGPINYWEEPGFAKRNPNFNPEAYANSPIGNPSASKDIPEGMTPKLNWDTDIDWAKWNPEIPKNEKLIEEYINIENSTKANNTWMKNPDGSKFKGSPEQFVQQQSQNFKKAFGNSKLVNPDGSPIMLYHGAPQKFNFFNPELFQRGDAGYSGVGIYTTPSKTTADSYAYSSRSSIGGKEHVPTVYELYGQANNPISAEELINEGGKRDLFNFNRQANWKGEVPVEERLTGYDAAIANTHPNVSRVRPWNEAYEIVFPTNTQLKSAVGNDGMFNMNNPNIYKALIPAIGTAGIVQASQKKNGGWLNKYK